MCQVSLFLGIYHDNIAIHVTQPGSVSIWEPGELMDLLVVELCFRNEQAMGGTEVK